jgi:hypothetical protein
MADNYSSLAPQHQQGGCDNQKESRIEPENREQLVVAALMLGDAHDCPRVGHFQWPCIRDVHVQAELLMAPQSPWMPGHEIFWR